MPSSAESLPAFNTKEQLPGFKSAFIAIYMRIGIKPDDNVGVMCHFGR